MTESEIDDKMSRQKFSVAYSGKNRIDDHTIDVEALAPALMAFGKLIRECNAEVNGKRSTSKVLVVSDFEHKCFNINFDVIVGYIEQLKTLLGDDPVKTAKEILELIGLRGAAEGTAALGGVSYLAYLKWKSGRNVVKADMTDKAKTGIVEVHVEGDNNPIHIHNHVYNLSNNPKALKATRDAFAPIGQDGFESVEFRDGDKVVEQIAPDDAQAILSSCISGPEEIEESVPEVDTTTAWLSVYSPVYDASVDKWHFNLGRDTIVADISATDIAKNALARGGAMADDAYQVKLEITTPKDPKGKPKKPTYKILQVIKFVPSNPTSQGSLFDENKK